jgi:hypothetical protein
MNTLNTLKKGSLSMAKAKIDDIGNDIEDLTEAEQQAIKGGLSRQEVLAQRAGLAERAVLTARPLAGHASVATAASAQTLAAGQLDVQQAVAADLPTRDALKK